MLTRLKSAIRPIGFILTLAVAALLLFSACGGGGGSNASAKDPGIKANSQPTSTPPPVVVIQIADNTFTPAEVTIKAGTTVRWNWGGSNPHSVVIGGADSGQHTGSGTYERTFRDGGTTLSYQCGVHGAAMAGKIIVE
jgi:plastocyanin